VRLLYLWGLKAPAKDTDRYFEKIEVDEKFKLEDARTISQADIQNFAGVSGDFHPLHVSEPFARSAANFDSRVAHGALVFVVTEAMVTDRNPKKFSYGHDTLRFVSPVYPGDTLTFERAVTDKETYDDHRMVT